MEKITIDATGKSLGRVATQAARYLLEKDSAHFAKNRVRVGEVVITNAGALKMTERKLTRTSYVRYSGYPGGLKKENLAALKVRKGLSGALRIAVSGMLPKNKLRAERLKLLHISE